jgi:ATPase subunit of ABC transporter with duplicated ATPase domains
VLRAINLSKHVDSEILFSGVDLILNRGDRVGLVGPNGAGKSTLLRILVGEEPPTGGQVVRAAETRLGYFAQHVADSQATVGQFLAEGLGEVHRVREVMRSLEGRLAAGEQAVLAEYGEAMDRWHALDGWNAATRLADVRQRLGVADLPDDSRLAQVSGGEQARLMLARVLLAEPTLLILDEPTSHLDADGIAWFAEWLAAYRGGVLLVSHDRALLDRAVNRIVELDGIHEQPQLYEGGYTAYAAEKARRWQRYLSDYEAQEKKRLRWEADIAATKTQARDVETTVRRGLGADQLRRYAKKVAKKAKARERRLRRQLDSARWLARPQTRPTLTVTFPAQACYNTVVLRAESVAATTAGRPLFRGLDLTVRAGERILVSGRNGAGKTTLLRVLAGEIAPTMGRVAVCGPVRLLPQTHDALRTSTTVLEFLRSRVPLYADEAEALLQTFLFTEQDWESPLWTLSAGELRRLLVATMVNTAAAALLLDEPTNYLDFDSLDVIEEALSTYQGTVIMVSHDEYFANRVGITRHWQLHDGRLVEAVRPSG